MHACVKSGSMGIFWANCPYTIACNRTKCKVFRGGAGVRAVRACVQRSGLFFLSQFARILSVCNAATSLLYTSGFLYPGPNRTCALVYKDRLKTLGSKDAVRISTPQARTLRGNVYTLLLRAVSVRLTARRTNRPLHECSKPVQRENTYPYKLCKV